MNIQKILAALAYLSCSTNAALAAAPALPAATATATEHWIASWSASPQPVWTPGFVLPTNIPASLSNQTVRQIARLSIGGKQVRITFSNAYGTTPLTIGAAHIALDGTAAAIIAGSDRVLTFGGRTSVTIAPGAPVLSDPVALELAPLAAVAVSVYLPQATALTTFHWEGKQRAYVAPGNLVAAAVIQSGASIEARLFLSAILVDAPASTRVVATFGDSITDGAGSSPNCNQRWPDLLAQRLSGQQVAVLNAGISGARMLRDKMGVNALARFDRDVLSQPNLATVILLMGINDIAWPGSSLAPAEPPVSVAQLIAGYRQLIARAHMRQVRIVGATLTPFEDALHGSDLHGYYSPAKEQSRQAVNQWLRSSGEFDAIIDFDAILRDPQHPRRYLPAFDSGDHLHPGDAGYRAMAAAIDLRSILPSGQR